MKWSKYAILLLLLLALSGCGSRQASDAGQVRISDDTVQNLYTEDDVISADLYFASKDMSSLVVENRALTMKLTDSFPACLVQALIDGPQEEGHQSLLPENGQVLSAEVRDGTCYLDLSASVFEPYIGTDAEEKLIVSSIVNTITQLPSVNEVMILMEGQKRQFYYASVRIDGPIRKVE